ncbi:hypothetical protein AB1L88_09660 [Tautonia sp. JC769]|uniref:hypothetical protein n=1 Tax=Tautonia sp. JC769 TaxID=3232135 RepID=UPI003457FADD
MATPSDSVSHATGPRTEAGKLASSFNAVSHGLTARRPLCDEEAERLILIADRWVAKHLPQTDSEEALIRSAAMEYVRYLRCADAEEARLQPATREAVRRWEESRRHAIRRKAQGLRDDPEAVVSQLQASAFGIDWLVRHWQTLLHLLDSGQGWAGSDLDTALRLTGRTAEFEDDPHVDARRLRDLVARVSPGAIRPDAAPGLADDPDALARLRALVVDRIDRLRDLRPIAWDDEEGPQRLAVETAALLDTSKDGQLRQRYRREALRDMQRSLSMVVNLKVERSKMDTRVLHQDRLAASSRPASEWFRSTAPHEPPAIPPRYNPPAPPPTAAAPAPEAFESRNERPDAPSVTPTVRHNPNQDNGNRPELPNAPSLDRRRTWPRPEAHPGAPGGPPESPSGAPATPGDPRPGA